MFFMAHIVFIDGENFMHQICKILREEGVLTDKQALLRFVGTAWELRAPGLSLLLSTNAQGKHLSK
jgi:hypothetical protein